MKIAYCRPEYNGVFYHRLQIPFVNLSNDSSYQIDEINAFMSVQHALRYDVIVINRYWYQHGLICEAKRKGVKLVVDIDDFWHLPGSHQFFKSPDKPKLIQYTLESLRIADVVWSSTGRLAEKVKKHNKNVKLIPNAIDFSQPQFQIKKLDKPEGFVFGWSGGSCHEKDLEILREPLKHIDNCSTMMCGYQESDLWQRMENVFSSGRPHYYRVPATDIYSYAGYYNMMDCALAPLVDDDFNRCKSNLKFLEAAAFKLPIICSDISTYNDSNIRCKPNEWLKTMNYIKDNPAYAEDQGNHNHEMVKRMYEIGVVNEYRKESLEALRK